MPDIYFTTEPDANALLATNDFALLVGMTLYQQIPVEKAFSGPFLLQERLGKPLDADLVAGMEPDDLEAVFKEKPALHRFPANMAKRTQAVASYIVDTYDSDPSGLWEGVESQDELFARIKELPGFGDYKASVYAAVLARHFGIQLEGWDANLPDWPNISEVTSAEGRAEMKERKKAWKTAAGT